MLSQVLLALRQHSGLTVRLLRRNLGVSAAVYQKAVPTDPIQGLFLQKLQDYKKKSMAAGGGPVEISAASEKRLQDELEKIARKYDATDASFLNFPTFSFTDPDIVQVGVDATAKAESKTVAEVEDLATAGEEKPHWEL